MGFWRRLRFYDLQLFTMGFSMGSNMFSSSDDVVISPFFVLATLAAGTSTVAFFVVGVVARLALPLHAFPGKCRVRLAAGRLDVVKRIFSV